MDIDAPFRDTSVGDAMLDGLDANQPLSAQALSKLHWRCRRGLLENDLFIQRFFERHESRLTVGQARGLYELMDLSDNDLLDLLLRRQNDAVQSLSDQAHHVLDLLQP